MVHRKFMQDYTEFMHVRKLIIKGSYTEATKVRYTALLEMKDKVYDIYSMHPNQPSAKKRKGELEDILDVRMGPKEHEYLENQLSNILRADPRKILCVPKNMDIDPVWDAQQQKKASLEDYQSKQIKSTVAQFEIVTMDDSLVDIDNNTVVVQMLVGDPFGIWTYMLMKI